jgi:hypothetical protein
MVETKARVFIDAWKDWQKFEPRVFKDTEITAADISKYSLLLIGGADANAVAAKLSPRLPLKVSAERVVIDGKAFAVRDAGVQLIYPNPRNAARYVWVFAGTSVQGMGLATPSPFRSPEWDYVIDDGHIPAPKQKAPAERTRVVSGMFDSNWRFNAEYLQMGDAEIRAKGRVLSTVRGKVSVGADLLDAYAGIYDLPNNRQIVITRKEDTLQAKAGGDEVLMVPIDQTTFYGEKFNVWVTFEKDAAGKVTGFTGHQPGDGDFEARRK